MKLPPAILLLSLLGLLRLSNAAKLGRSDHSFNQHQSELQTNCPVSKNTIWEYKTQIFHSTVPIVRTKTVSKTNYQTYTSTLVHEFTTVYENDRTQRRNLGFTGTVTQTELVTAFEYLKPDYFPVTVHQTVTNTKTVQDFITTTVSVTETDTETFIQRTSHISTDLIPFHTTETFFVTVAPVTSTTTLTQTKTHANYPFYTTKIKSLTKTIIKTVETLQIVTPPMAIVTETSSTPVTQLHFTSTRFTNTVTRHIPFTVTTTEYGTRIGNIVHRDAISQTFTSTIVSTVTKVSEIINVKTTVMTHIQTEFVPVTSTVTETSTDTSYSTNIYTNAIASEVFTTITKDSYVTLRQTLHPNDQTSVSTIISPCTTTSTSITFVTVTPQGFREGRFSGYRYTRLN